jgi:integrase
MLPLLAREALADQRRRQDAAHEAVGSAWQDRLDLVFTDAVGRPANQTSPSRAFRRAADLLGLQRVRLHDLRHTNASLMLNAGTPLEVVSRNLGHSGLSITFDTYSHLAPEVQREAAAGLDRALAEGDS